MGIFEDLKNDLSQAVNELLPPEISEEMDRIEEEEAAVKAAELLAMAEAEVSGVEVEAPIAEVAEDAMVSEETIAEESVSEVTVAEEAVSEEPIAEEMTIEETALVSDTDDMIDMEALQKMLAEEGIVIPEENVVISEEDGVKAESVAEAEAANIAAEFASELSLEMIDSNCEVPEFSDELPVENAELTEEAVADLIAGLELGDLSGEFTAESLEEVNPVDMNAADMNTADMNTADMNATAENISDSMTVPDSMVIPNLEEDFNLSGSDVPVTQDPRFPLSASEMPADIQMEGLQEEIAADLEGLKMPDFSVEAKLDEIKSTHEEVIVDREISMDDVKESLESVSEKLSENLAEMMAEMMNSDIAEGLPDVEESSVIEDMVLEAEIPAEILAEEPSTDMLEAPMAGAVMDEMPMDEMPMDQMPMDEVPMDEVPMDEMPMDEVPMDEMPMDEIPMDEISGEDPLAQEPLPEGYYAEGTPLDTFGKGEALAEEIPAMEESTPIYEAPVEAIPIPPRDPSTIPVAELAIIPVGMKVIGKVITDGPLEVQGIVNGDLDVLGKLSVSGFITGNSRAHEVFAEKARITGDINSETSVKIGRGTIIVGNITGYSAAIAGAVKGDIDIHGPVILDSSAIVLGNIKSRSVQINNGAVVEGLCSQCYSEVDPNGIFNQVEA